MRVGLDEGRRGPGVLLTPRAPRCTALLQSHPGVTDLVLTAPETTQGSKWSETIMGCTTWMNAKREEKRPF